MKKDKKKKKRTEKTGDSCCCCYNVTDACGCVVGSLCCGNSDSGCFFVSC